MGFEQGELLLYQSDNGQSVVDVRLKDETVWLSQGTDDRTVWALSIGYIFRHVSNVYKEKELDRHSNMQKMHIANSDKTVAFYDLDVIIMNGGGKDRRKVSKKMGNKNKVHHTLKAKPKSSL